MLLPPGCGAGDSLSRHIPGKARLGLFQANEFRRRCVVACGHLARNPFGDIIDHHCVLDEIAVLIARHTLEHIKEAENANFNAGFLAHLADDGVQQFFAMFEAAAGNRPLPQERRLATLDDEDILATKHDCADADSCCCAHAVKILYNALMCGRFYLKSPPAEVASLFDVDVRDNFPPRYNICPTQPVAVIRQNEMRKREYALMRWAFTPSWAKGEFLENLAKRPLINARSETVLEKASFRSAFRRRRCLVPADGFYEWQSKPAKAKQPFAIHKRKDGLFGFAGIWETAVDSNGGEIDTLALLTVAAGPDIRSLHSREPVVIAPESYKLWLEADERDADLLTALLGPAPSGFWSSYPVSTEVNSPRHDGPHLLEPLPS